MPRALGIEYPGAIYHVMNRGDRDHNRLQSTKPGVEPDTQNEPARL